MKSFFVWPTGASESFRWVAAALLGLLLLAVVLEWLRQILARRRRVNAAWLAVRQLAQEKALSENEWTLLEAFLQQWSRKDPVRAVTSRQHFDSCVEKHMSALRNELGPSEFAEIGARLHDIRCQLGLEYVPLGQRIVSTRELHQGQYMWVTPASASVPQWMAVTLSEVTEAHLIAAMAREDEPRIHALNTGDEVRCRLWREEDARYAFTVPFVRLESDPPLLVLGHSAHLERIQSRAHYRVRYYQNTIVGVLDAPQNDDYSDIRDRRAVTRLRGRITSLSAGGFALVLPQAAPKQVLLRITLELPSEDPFDAEARIVSTSGISGGRYLVRAAFVGMAEETQDKIARYVMRRQQPQLQTAVRVE